MSHRRSKRPIVFAAVAVVLLGSGLTAILALAPASTDAATGPAGADRSQCDARIAEVNRGFGVSLTRLAHVAQAEPTVRCDAYRTHLTALETARVVYGSCMTGFARKDQMDQLELAYTDWRSAIQTRCAE